MSLVCHSCAGDIKESHVICRGFCNATFHPRCCGIAADAFEEVMKNHQVFWLCKSCTSLMKDIRFRNAARSAHEVGLEEALNTHSDIMQNLKTEILNELKAEIRTNFATMINSNSFTPRSTRPTTMDSRLTKGRRLFTTFDDTNRNQKPRLLQGTGSTLSPSTEIVIVPATEPKFWLYLSRIAPEVSADQVSILAKKRLGSDDIQVTRLVPKGRDMSTLSFVSFKIGMNADLRNRALSSSSWPKGVVFREFSDNKTVGNFWRPKVPPNDPLNISPESEVVAME